MSELRTIVHVDKSDLTPDDYIGPSKTIIGKPKVYDLKTGKLIASEMNLVVLDGREFLAEKLFNLSNDDEDLRKYEIRYFGVGSGGADGTNTSDPYDTDTELADPKKISTSGISTNDNGYKYIKDGYLKKISSDNGEIKIVKETLVVNTSDGDEEVQKYTAIKCVLILTEDEPADKPFTFNEAGLYAVKYDDDDNPTDDVKLFARFTTTDKNLGPNDGIRIEWTILV